MSGKNAHTEALREFLVSRENSSSRAAILMHRLIYDLQLAAAERSYFLEVYQGEVDQDGFDIILDDRDVIKKIQVKTVASETNQSTWKIHRVLLRPHRCRLEELGFEPSPEGAGYEGGFVLMDFRCTGSAVDLDYCYTDIYVLRAFELGIVRRKDKRKQETIKRLCRNLRSGTSHERISVPRNAILKAKGAGHLLALAGLHSPISTSWAYSVLKHAVEKDPLTARYAAHELRELILDTDVEYCAAPCEEARRTEGKPNA